MLLEAGVCKVFKAQPGKVTTVPMVTDLTARRMSAFAPGQ